MGVAPQPEWARPGSDRTRAPASQDAEPEPSARALPAAAPSLEALETPACAEGSGKRSFRNTLPGCFLCEVSLYGRGGGITVTLQNGVEVFRTEAQPGLLVLLSGARRRSPVGPLRFPPGDS